MEIPLMSSGYSGQAIDFPLNAKPGTAAALRLFARHIDKSSANTATLAVLNAVYRRKGR